MDADLLRSGLAASDMDAVADPPDAAAAAFGASPTSPSYSFPYYLPDGTRHSRVWRKRLHNPAKGEGKYLGPKKADLIAAGGDAHEATLPYFNPYILALGGLTFAALGADATPKTWLLVEGEKKAVAAMKYIGRPAIGFSGAYNALYRPEPTVTPTGAATPSQAALAAIQRPFELHPSLAAMFHPGDTVDVVFDGDVQTNPDVNRAAGTLRQVMGALGIEVRFVLLPKLADGKLGLDDWIMGVQDKSLVATLFDALERTDGQTFDTHLPTLYDALGLTLNAKGSPLANASNIVKVMESHAHTRGRMYFDVVRNRLFETFSNGTLQQVNDHTGMYLTIWMQNTLGLHHFTHKLVTECLLAVASDPQYARNPVLEEIEAVKWDGVPRLEELFITAFGADDTPYTRMVGKYWATGAMARLTMPGCQMDNMLVLEGDQGVGKSKALEILGGSGYIASQQKMDNKDFIASAHTAWVVDMVELGAMRYADMEQIKGYITTRTDTFRSVWGRMSLNRPRRFVMVGSTNTDDYLRDPSGNRRFWPVKCNGQINLQWLQEFRPQIWAEALHRLRAGEQWWEDFNAPTAVATRAEQDARVAFDPWEDMLAAILNDTTSIPKVSYNGKQHPFLSTADLLLRLGAERNSGTSRRLAGLMRRTALWKLDKTVNLRGYFRIDPVAPSTNVVQLPQPTKF
jgi:putative DNA primase/helicase